MGFGSGEKKGNQAQCPAVIAEGHSRRPANGSCRTGLTFRKRSHPSRQRVPSILQFGIHTAPDPIEVTFESCGDREYDKLGRVIGMFPDDAFLQRAELRPGRLENDQHLRAGFDFVLPPVEGLDSWNQIGARHQSQIEGCPGQPTRGFQIGRRHKNNCCSASLLRVRHTPKNKWRNRLCKARARREAGASDNSFRIAYFSVLTTSRP